MDFSSCADNAGIPRLMQSHNYVIYTQFITLDDEELS